MNCNRLVEVVTFVAYYQFKETTVYEMVFISNGINGTLIK